MSNRTTRIALAAVTALSLMGTGAGTALARHGADDPAGHHRHHRADDGARHDRHDDRGGRGSDDGAGHR